MLIVPSYVRELIRQQRRLVEVLITLHLQTQDGQNREGWSIKELQLGVPQIHRILGLLGTLQEKACYGVSVSGIVIFIVIKAARMLGRALSSIPFGVLFHQHCECGESQYVSQMAAQMWCCYTLLSRAISPTHMLCSWAPPLSVQGHRV